MKHPSHDFDTLRSEIMARLPQLSKQLQNIARLASEHPNDIGLQAVTMIARHIGVAPSATIRFAEALSY
jgi:DNA-binding MurR/RpiR family transcriptional regulator